MIFFEAFYVTGIKLINMETENTVKVLIAEDDDGHADLIIDVLQRSGVKNEILRFTDGVDLSAYLDKEGRNSGLVAGKSFLVLLDINMPRMDGVEVLQKMKADDELKNIPVIMLTTTDDPREIDLCYRSGCSVYLTKPIDYQKFEVVLLRLGLLLQVASV
ncbi:MAG: hypothetical protein RIS29_498 [Bacteroidota bacterium]